MHGLDDTDREILRLLLEDGRRPYREIASEVELSAPAVSDRVERLRELGLLADTAWQPNIGQAELDLECVECGNSVTAEGTRETLDGTTYHFCCPSCRDNFVQQYEELSEGA